VPFGDVSVVVPVVQDVVDELVRARALFPAFHSAHEGYAVMLEEVDELWQLVKGKRGPENAAAMRAEAIQIAAMAVRFVIDLCDRPAPPR
jgi:hypothetical protein